MTNVEEMISRCVDLTHDQINLIIELEDLKQRVSALEEDVKLLRNNKGNVPNFDQEKHAF